MKLEVKLFNIDKSPKGRIYTNKCINNAIKEWNTNEDNGYFHLGQIGNVEHSTTFQPLELTNISHKITNLHLDGTDVKCDILPLETPMGRLLTKTIEADKFNLYRTQIWFDPTEWEETVDENGNKIITKCKIERIDLVCIPNHDLV